MKLAATALASVTALATGLPAEAGDRHGWGGHGDGHWRGHDHHHYSSPRIGFYLGAPLLWPGYDYWGWRDPYPTVTQVVVQREPQVYVQRETPVVSPPAPEYWYYCPDSKTYYPYAQTCPSGWLQVVPQTVPGGPQ